MVIVLVTEYYNKFNDLTDSSFYNFQYFDFLSIKCSKNRRFELMKKHLFFPFNKLNCAYLINFH